jgi:8-oxo-dGTP pyrophosphatase MutT (NUDIX family)
MDLERFAQHLAKRPRRVIEDAGRPRAAVLVALYGPGPDFQVIYTVRTQHVEHHKGEISFPGGGRDPEDASETHTALREAFEEVGIWQRDVSVLGVLDDVITRSNFVVTPVVGRLARHPYEFKLYAPEVAELLAVPLSHLTDRLNYVPHPLLPPDRQPPFPSYKFGEHVIFGATALMTSRFLGVLSEAR